MNRNRLIVAVVFAGCLVVGVFILKRKNLGENASSHPEVPVTVQKREVPVSTPQPGVIPDQTKSSSGGNLYGERILQGYALGSPIRDVQLMGTLLSNYRMLAKGVDSRHYSTNEGVSTMLKGNGVVRLPALSENHPVFNDQGLIVDRWGEPWFFHLVSRDKLDIYSPGEDGEYGTDDDLSFVSGRPAMGKVEF